MYRPPLPPLGELIPMPNQPCHDTESEHKTHTCVTNDMSRTACRCGHVEVYVGRDDFVAETGRTAAAERERRPRGSGSGRGGVRRRGTRRRGKRGRVRDTAQSRHLSTATHHRTVKQRVRTKKRRECAPRKKGRSSGLRSWE